ncbi:MAG TPA: hypothetical protein VKF42_02700 [Chitinivibrionales bacterium]|nr:hypothetical protein [Chitinivibrionales bacterium]
MRLFFANKTLPAQRFNAQKLDHGRVVSGGSTAFTIVAGVQPVSAQQLAMLEEGKRTKINYSVISKIELMLTRPNTPADQVEIDGAWFEVSLKDPCSSDVLNHFEYVVTKIENVKDS